MIIKMQSMITGKTNEMDLPITKEQHDEWFGGGGRRMVQDIFPELTPNQREFLLTGLTPEEWVQFLEEEEHEHE